jgi:SRSO17 transposase
VDLHGGPEAAARFAVYAADLASVLGHADRIRPFEDYCAGLLSTEGRKSVEPLAAVTAPQRNISLCCIWWRRRLGPIRRC